MNSKNSFILSDDRNLNGYNNNKVNAWIGVKGKTDIRPYKYIRKLFQKNVEHKPMGSCAMIDNYKESSYDKSVKPWPVFQPRWACNSSL